MRKFTPAGPNFNPFNRDSGAGDDADGIRIEPLTTARILQVFPLIREAVPQVRLEEWTRFARPRTGARRRHCIGIRVAMVSGNPYPCGLYSYRVETQLLPGSVLVADHFVAIDLLDARPVVDRLIVDLESLALKLNCTEVRSIIQYRSTQAAQPLFAAGYHPHGMIFGKTLSGTGFPLPPVALT
jgi:hypothetical protein